MDRSELFGAPSAVLAILRCVLAILAVIAIVGFISTAPSPDILFNELDDLVQDRSGFAEERLRAVLNDILPNGTFNDMQTVEAAGEILDFLRSCGISEHMGMIRLAAVIAAIGVGMYVSCELIGAYAGIALRFFEKRAVLFHACEWVKALLAFLLFLSCVGLTVLFALTVPSGFGADAQLPALSVIIPIGAILSVITLVIFCYHKDAVHAADAICHGGFKANANYHLTGLAIVRGVFALLASGGGLLSLPSMSFAQIISAVTPALVALRYFCAAASYKRLRDEFD